MRRESRPLVRNLRGWTCASCSHSITRIEDGWVEWLAVEDRVSKLKGLRLVHTIAASPRGEKKTGCRYDQRREFQKGGSIVEGLPLERFVGPDGLMLLLSFLAGGDFPRNDVLELTKRVQIPGYEQTRELFDVAIHSGVVNPSIRAGYYLQWEIHELLDWAEHEIRSSASQGNS